MKYNSLQQAVIGVLQEKKIKHPNQQVLDVHEPEKDELTAKDFEMLRKGKSGVVKAEEVDLDEEQVDEVVKVYAKTTFGGTHLRHDKTHPNRTPEQQAQATAHRNAAAAMVKAVRKTASGRKDLKGSFGAGEATHKTDDVGQSTSVRRYYKEEEVREELDLLESLLESDHLDEGILDTIKKKAGDLEDKIKGNFRPKRNDTNLDRVKNVLGRVEDKIKGNFRHTRNDTNMDRIKKAASNVKTHAIRAASKVGLASRFHPALRKEEFTLDDFTDEELEAFLQSEEAQQLDELSYDTLNSYMKGRRKQIDRAARAGVSTGTGTRSSEKLEKNIRGYRKAWAKRDMKEDVEPVQETIILHDSFDVQLKDAYTFGDFLTAAKKLFGEERAIEVANTAFQDQDIELFVEEMSHSAVEERVKAHMKAGHKVSMPKYSTRDGKPRAEYVVTDKDSGVRRKYIHQGNVTKMENMGARGKRDEK